MSGDLDGAAALADAPPPSAGRSAWRTSRRSVSPHGITLVRRGNVEAGMRLLDEGSVVAASEELRRVPLVAGRATSGWPVPAMTREMAGTGEVVPAADPYRRRMLDATLTVYGPGDPGYQDACTLFNSMIERRPALVALRLARRRDGRTCAARARASSPSPSGPAATRWRACR